jgi:hypothetical protein
LDAVYLLGRGLFYISNDYIVTDGQGCHNTFHADYRPCIWFRPIDAHMHLSRRSAGGLGITGLQTAIAPDVIRRGTGFRGGMTPYLFGEV